MPSYATSDINQGTAVKLHSGICEACKMLAQVLLPNQLMQSVSTINHHLHRPDDIHHHQELYCTDLTSTSLSESVTFL